MEHRQLKGLIEEYCEGTLSPEVYPKVTQHLAQCHECKQHLRLIRLTQGITAASKGIALPFPAPGFSRPWLLEGSEGEANFRETKAVPSEAPTMLPSKKTIAINIKALNLDRLIILLSPQNLTGWFLHPDAS